MKKEYLIFLVLLAVLGVALSSPVKAPLSQDQVKVTAHAPGRDLAPVSAVKSVVQESKKERAIKEYQEAAYALADKIEFLGLDGDELNKTFNRVGKDKFLKHLPEEVRGDYMKLEEKISALRDFHLNEDGMTSRFFTKYQAVIPEWISREREALDNVGLPSEVESLISRKIHEAEINNEEISEILFGCGKGNAACINKAFALLIDANHALLDEQLKMIQEHL